MNAVLNIVQEGTGTRCPLDTTCIHDDRRDIPLCSLKGEELVGGGDDLSVDKVFDRITSHNKKLASEDRFSTTPLRLVFRSKAVQNMRFVDTPGIITNKGTGKDNRKEIMGIIQSEIERPNTKLCVLLEATEYSKNPIVDFLDESLKGRDNWIGKATFLMTKFDKQAEDSRTASKANGFFREFHDIKCFPHLVITPTLPKEDLAPTELYGQRKELLLSADEYEKRKFDEWLNKHEEYRQANDDKEILHQQVSSRLKFSTAKKVMREIMLEDTAKRLPEVLASLRKELGDREKEQKRLLDIQKFNDPRELKSVVQKMLYKMDNRVQRYLDGDLESSIKFPERMQTLDDELDEEENSEWSNRELNHYTEREDYWRDRVAQLEVYPEEINPESKFLGGKQYQRAYDFFKVVMFESLPDPFQLEELVPNITGHLAGGLLRENWERATVEIVRVCLKEVSHPGINFLVKHVGSIFRRLFKIAMDDIKLGEQFSSTFKLLPRGVEKELNEHFDSLLWKLMKNAASMTHNALEPMYSTVDPGLPTFHPTDPDESEEAKEGMIERLSNKLSSLVSGDANQAKAWLREENRVRARSKQNFLPDERTSMITKEETKKILHRSFEYIVALMEHNLVNLRFQINHYLFVEFKEMMREKFVSGFIDETDWDKLVEPDSDLAERLKEVQEQIKALNESLQEVQKMNRRF